MKPLVYFYSLSHMRSIDNSRIVSKTCYFNGFSTIAPIVTKLGY